MEVAGGGKNALKKRKILWISETSWGRIARRDPYRGEYRGAE